MANDINNVVLVGRMTKDFELKFTSGGMAIGKISLAVGRSVKKNEQWTNESSFFDVTIFGKYAETLNKWLHKGSRVAVKGELRQERWQDKEGKAQSRVGIVADEVQNLDPKPQDAGQAPQQQRGPRLASQPESIANHDFGNTAGFDDDIPFM